MQLDIRYNMRTTWVHSKMSSRNKSLIKKTNQIKRLPHKLSSDKSISLPNLQSFHRIVVSTFPLMALQCFALLDIRKRGKTLQIEQLKDCRWHLLFNSVLTTVYNSCVRAQFIDNQSCKMSMYVLIYKIPKYH